MGIITNHCLWATEIQYLNDASEYRYGEKLTNEVISRRRKGARGKNKEFFSEYIAHASFLRNAHYFVTSLSEHGDLLSQWRGYTPDGNGFSLGFNVEKMNRILSERREFEFVPCIYDRSEQENLINNLIDYALDMWEQDATPFSEYTTEMSAYPPLLLRVFSSFLAPILKDASFSEEKEWRLILLQNDIYKRRFRMGKSFVTPYLEIDLLEKPGSPGSMPLDEVIIGPTPNPDLSTLSIRMLLESQGVKAQTRLSTVPFRSW